MADDTRAELRALAHAWDRAMVTNDAEAIARFMADEWTIVGSDGNLGGREPFLALIRSGDLSHDVMTSEELDVRVYGDAAVIIARGVSGGLWRGQPFRETERSSSVFVRRDGEWRCVLTALAKVG